MSLRGGELSDYVVSLRRELHRHPKVSMEVVQPFPEYDRQRDVKSRKRMEFLIRNSTECVIMGKSASQGNYVLANRYLVDHAQFLIDVSEHAGDLLSDMTQMEAYACQKDLGMIFIHPDTVEVKGVF